MTEIIPSINARTFEEVKERIKKVEPYVSWCHLDVTDGVFSKHLTWYDPRDFVSLVGSDPTKQGQTLLTLLSIEVHLMVAEPEKIIEQWLVKPVKRLIFHIEAMKDPEMVIKKCRDAGVAVGFAINPETFWGKLEPWFGKCDIYQVLAVHPGPSGQELTEETYDKVIHIRKACPQCIIEVDGGVNPETAKRALESGANLLVAGNYIFSSEDIKQAIENLRGRAS